MKKILLRVAALLLTLLLCTLPLISCASRGKTLMTLEKNGIKVTLSVNLYELMLSRMKGVLYNNGSTFNGVRADKDNFWNYTGKFDGVNVQSLDEFYCQSILGNCRTYLVTLFLFEELGLKLSQAELDDVDQRLEELVRIDGNGSKTKLNSVLSAYGVNYDILKEAYTIEKKINAVQTALYGANATGIDASIKREFMKENYVHFRQIYLPSYDYVCETDENGDVIYYYDEGTKKGHVYYDVHNGEPHYDGEGDEILDEHGDVIYFKKDGTGIAYDSTNGSPAYVMSKEDSTRYEIKEKTPEELTALQTYAEELLGKMQGATMEAFEQTVAEECIKNYQPNDMEAYPDGYYLDRKFDYAAAGEDTAYLATIIEKLDTVADGAVALIKSPYGYHIIKKYAHTENAYELEANEVWFERFSSNLTEELFLDKCESYYADIQINEKVLADAPNMKEVAVNSNLI